MWFLVAISFKGILSIMKLIINSLSNISEFERKIYRTPFEYPAIDENECGLSQIAVRFNLSFHDWDMSELLLLLLLLLIDSKFSLLMLLSLILVYNDDNGINCRTVCEISEI